MFRNTQQDHIKKQTLEQLKDNQRTVHAGSSTDAIWKHDTCRRTGKAVGAVNDVQQSVSNFVQNTLHEKILYTHPDGHCLRRPIGKIYGMHPGEVIQYMRKKCKKMIDNDQRLYIEGNESWYEAVRDRPKEWNTIKNNVEVDPHCTLPNT
jgi:hypothetical protein